MFPLRNEPARVVQRTRLWAVIRVMHLWWPIWTFRHFRLRVFVRGLYLCKRPPSLSRILAVFKSLLFAIMEVKPSSKTLRVWWRPRNAMYAFRQAELVGKRFLCVREKNYLRSNSRSRRVSSPLDYQWKVGVIRACSEKDFHHSELKVRGYFY